MKKIRTENGTNRHRNLINNMSSVMARKGMTDEALGLRVGRRSNYINVLKNSKHMPGLPLALLIARALGEPVERIWSLGDKSAA